LQVWSLANCKLKTEYVGHNAYLNSVTVSPDGSLCASGGKVCIHYIACSIQHASKTFWSYEFVKHGLGLQSQYSELVTGWTNKELWFDCWHGQDFFFLGGGGGENFPTGFLAPQFFLGGFISF